MYFLQRIKNQFATQICFYANNLETGGSVAEKTKDPAETSLVGPDDIRAGIAATKKVGETMDLRAQGFKEQQARLKTSVSKAGTTLSGEKGPDQKNLNTITESETIVSLQERGVSIEIDRRIGGFSESELLSNFLDKNPSVDGKKLYELVSGKFPGMSETEIQHTLAGLSPEQYNKILEASLLQMTKLAEEENKNGEPIDASRKLSSGEVQKNDFSLSRILSGISGLGNSRPMSYSGGESGTFEAPEVSNAELLAAVEKLAGTIGAQPAALKAVVAVESGGKMNATRFEPHHASKGRDEATSFGAFQIMGFNARSLGYNSASDMKQKFVDGGVEEQVRAFGAFLKTRNLVQHISQDTNPPDFRSFARGYNGTDYARMGYHLKMQGAYNKYNSQSQNSVSA